MESKKNKQNQTQKQTVEWWLPDAGEWGKQGDIGQRIRLSSDKMSKF